MRSKHNDKSVRCLVSFMCQGWKSWLHTFNIDKQQILGAPLTKIVIEVAHLDGEGTGEDGGHAACDLLYALRLGQ